MDTDFINSHLKEMLVCLCFRDGSDYFMCAEVSHLYFAVIKNKVCAVNNEDTALIRFTKLLLEVSSLMLSGRLSFACTTHTVVTQSWLKMGPLSLVIQQHQSHTVHSETK